LVAAVISLGLFALWTLLVLVVDVQPVGPRGAAVGLAFVNRFFHELTGVHMVLYILTDWLGLIPIAVAMGFGALGLVQWIGRRRLSAVDHSILVLGGFCVVVMLAYVFFEAAVVNERPVLINGQLEASYPSSTTMLTICVMTTARMQLRGRIKNRLYAGCLAAVIEGFTVFMVLARLISGVHWLSDIIGGVLLSTGLVLLYAAICRTER